MTYKVGLYFGNSTTNGTLMRYGLSNGTTTTNILKQVSYSNGNYYPNNRFQALPSPYDGAERTISFCTPVGFIISLANKGTENQTVTIFNYGSMRYNGTNTFYTNFFNRRFSALDETTLDLEMNEMNTYRTGHSGTMQHTFAAPHSQWDLSGIDNFFIYWPFSQNRLILFNLKVKDYTI